MRLSNKYHNRTIVLWPIVIEVNDYWDRIGRLFIQRGWRSDIRKCYDAWKATNTSFSLERGKQHLSKWHLKIIKGNDIAVDLFVRSRTCR